MINLNLSPATRWGLNVAALLGLVFSLRLGQTIFIPLVIAVLLAAMLWPAATWLHQGVRLPWGISCMVAVGLLVLLNLLITLSFVAAFTKIIQDVPNPNLVDEGTQQKLYTKFRNQLERLSPVPLDREYFPEDARESRLYQYVKETLRGENVTKVLWVLVEYANNWVWQWVLIMFILLFLLLEGPMLSRRFVEIFGPSGEAQTRAVDALSDMANQVRTFLVWRTIINFVMAIMVGLLYSWMELQQSWTWALLTAVLCYIPYLGPIAAGIPPIIDALVSSPTPWHALFIAIIYLVIVTMEGYVVVPVVMGRSMELNATTVMLACLFWDLVWGMSGLFLAMPLMAAIKAVCFHVPEMRPWANLMSTTEIALEEEVSPKDATMVISEEEAKALEQKRHKPDTDGKH